MTPEFVRWFQRYLELQRDRARGAKSDFSARTVALEAQLDNLAVGNIYARSLASSLLAIDRASVCSEERDFEGAFRELADAEPTLEMPSDIRSVIESSRALIEGNIYLVQERLDDAVMYFERAKAIGGEAASVTRANAGFNLGVIRMIQGEFDTSRNEFEFAMREYASVGLANKVADCRHQLGLILRQHDETMGVALGHLMAALDTYIAVEDVYGQWRALDDMARLWMIWAGAASEDETRKGCLDRAMTTSTGAAMAAARLWRNPNFTEGRLTDLSDQLLNHVMTHCEVCDWTDNLPHLVGALAVNKGRIRAVSEDIPGAALIGQDPDLIAALRDDDPRAFVELIYNSLPRLNSRRETVAVVDQIGLRGDRLLTAVTVLGEERCYDAFTSEFYPPGTIPVRRSLRGRDRCHEVGTIAARLIEKIRIHGGRCTMLLGDAEEPTTDVQRNQLAVWAAELDDDLKRLGKWFFPDSLLTMLRELNVTHVVHVPDPLFATVPYLALQTAVGAVVDQPWSLSQVSSALELLRIAHRPTYQGTARPMLWMAPDAEANSNRGGASELEALRALLPIEERIEQDATLTRACAALRDGRWVHFRGHGMWNDDVATSGPVFSNSEILNRAALESCRSDIAGFLCTVACYTGFSASVGSETFGSLVDYDRAGLQGALLTRWPIHGPAAVPFIRRFYSVLLETGHVGKALQQASRQTRDSSPHPYLWAPFVALGAWETQPK